MENQKFVKELKFGIGDGHLQYYLFNYRFPARALPVDGWARPTGQWVNGGPIKLAN